MLSVPTTRARVIICLFQTRWRNVGSGTQGACSVAQLLRRRVLGWIDSVLWLHRNFSGVSGFFACFFPLWAKNSRAPRFFFAWAKFGPKGHQIRRRGILSDITHLSTFFPSPDLPLSASFSSHYWGREPSRLAHPFSLYPLSLPSYHPEIHLLTFSSSSRTLFQVARFTPPQLDEENSDQKAQACACRARCEHFTRPHIGPGSGGNAHCCRTC